MIPVQNLYYILCYAWNRLEEGNIISVDQVDREDIAGLFGKVMAEGISHILRRGLDRGYILRYEESGSIRGRIDFASTLKTNFFSKPSLVCNYDVLSHDVLHNQILKSTVKKLLYREDINDEIRNELRDIYFRMHQVSEVDLSKKCFRLVQLNRNNGFYEFLLNVCELICDDLLITKTPGQSSFREYIQDEVKMRKIFEQFVRNFYDKELKKYKVKSKTIKWDASGSKEDLSVLPNMLTDVYIESDLRKIVLDTKYYKETLSENWGAEKIRSANLYQMFAYLKNLEKEVGLNGNCEGILLYPTVKGDYSHDYEIQGHRLSVRTINLNQGWREIHKDLVDIIC